MEPPAEAYPRVTVSYLGEAAKLVALKMVENLRTEGIGAILTPGNRSLKAQLKAADRIRASFAVLLGEDEVNAKQAAIRNMNDGQQTRVELTDVVDWFRERL